MTLIHGETSALIGEVRGGGVIGCVCNCGGEGGGNCVCVCNWVCV